MAWGWPRLIAVLAGLGAGAAGCGRRAVLGCGRRGQAGAAVLGGGCGRLVAGLAGAGGGAGWAGRITVEGVVAGVVGRGEEGERVVAGEQGEEYRGRQLGQGSRDAGGLQRPGGGVDPLVGGQRGGDRQVAAGQRGGAAGP